VKTDNLENFPTNFQARISKLSTPLQRIFFDDLSTAAENRLRVLEKVGLKN
jgi:hypothetical protein